MQLPKSIAEHLANDLEEFLDNLPDHPDPEMVTGFILEQLEIYADEYVIDDIVMGLEESGALETPLAEALEAEMASNADFEFTEAECVNLLAELCDIEWVEGDDDDFDEDDDIDEDDFDEDDLDDLEDLDDDDDF